MKRQVGLFGGTFNPVHFGHISLALELKEKKGLDEVWWIPAHCSPLKIQESILPIHHRLKMLELALETIPSFQICTLELDRPPPSYTVDTVKFLMEAHPDCSFSLLVGEDALVRFNQWKEPDQLINLLPLLIGSRPHSNLLEGLPELGFSEEIANAVRKGIVLTRQLDISASDLRERIKKRLYCYHLLPAKVLDYIYAHQLYFNALT